MKQRILSAAIYLISALALALYFDSLYGTGPVMLCLGAIHAGIAGAIVFVVACLVSLSVCGWA
jgi:hypothetical protein